MSHEFCTGDRRPWQLQTENESCSFMQETVIIQDCNYNTEVLKPESARVNSFKIATKYGNDLFIGDILEFSTIQNYAVWERKKM